MFAGQVLLEQLPATKEGKVQDRIIYALQVHYPRVAFNVLARLLREHALSLVYRASMQPVVQPVAQLVA